MNSDDLGKYLSATDGFQKPWLLVQLRLKKLQEQRDRMQPDEYLAQMQDIYNDLTKLGEWWVGIEDEVF